MKTVTGGRLPGRTWRVTRGTGMGLPHSGAVSDSALFQLAEAGWAANSRVMTRHKVVAWLRFRDDIWAVGNDRELFRAYESRLLGGSPRAGL